MQNIIATKKRLLRNFITSMVVATAVTTSTVPVYAAEDPKPLSSTDESLAAKTSVDAFLDANKQTLIAGVLAGDYTFFDPVAYLKANPDLASLFNGNLQAAINHYFSLGAFEGRSSMGRVDLVAAIVSHPEVLATGKMDISTVVTNFATVTGQSIDTVTTVGIVIGATSDGSLGVASVAPTSPAAATTNVSVGMVFTSGAATNPNTNGQASMSASTSNNNAGVTLGDKNSSSSSDSSDKSSETSSSKHQQQSFDDFVEAVPMAERFSTYTEYNAAVNAWVQSGIALGYLVATPGGEYAYAMTMQAWFNVPAYIQEQSSWIKSKPTAEYFLKQTGYYVALEAWEKAKPNEANYYYSETAYETAYDNWANSKPTYVTFMSESDLASFNEEMAQWKADEPKVSDYLYGENTTYATEVQAKAAYEFAYDAWEKSEPLAVNFITDELQRTYYGMEIAEWETKRPNIRDFFGENGRLDEARYNNALTAWQSKEPEFTKYMSREELDAYSNALCAWDTNKPNSSDYVYSDEYFSNAAEAQAAYEADLAAYNARQALTVTSSTVYSIDNQTYTDFTEASNALTAYKAKMTANAEIQGLTLDACKTTYWYFDGQAYYDADEAASAYEEFDEIQKELAKTVSDYKTDNVATWYFNGCQFDQTDEINAEEAFTKWCAEQNAKIAISELGTTDDALGSFKNNGDFYFINWKYYLKGDEEEEAAARAALEEQNAEEGEDKTLENIGTSNFTYWEFNADTYGETKRIIQTGEEELAFIENSLIPTIEAWKSANEPDSNYVKSKGINARADINDFTDTRSNWTVDGTQYESEPDAEVAMAIYHGGLGIKDYGWSAGKTVSHFENTYWTVDGVQYTTSETANTALENYQDSHEVDEGYDSEKGIDDYGDTRYTYEGSEVSYVTEESARTALAEYKDAVSNPGDGSSYSYNKYASTEAANAAYEAALSAYLGAHPEPKPSDYATDGDYLAAAEEWEASKPVQDDYVRASVAVDVLEEDTEDYVSEHPAPAESDYAQFTDSTASNYVDLDGKTEEWEKSKPEKDDYSYSSDDSDDGDADDNGSDDSGDTDDGSDDSGDADDDGSDDDGDADDDGSDDSDDDN